VLLGCSVLAPWLIKIVSLYQLIFAAINTSNRQPKPSIPNPASQLLTADWDFKKWMKPYLAAFKGHSKYYLFWFILGTPK